MRIWYQSFVDPEQQTPYLHDLTRALQRIAGPDVEFDVHGITPPDLAASTVTYLIDLLADAADKAAERARRPKSDVLVLDSANEPEIELDPAKVFYDAVERSRQR